MCVTVCTCVNVSLNQLHKKQFVFKQNRFYFLNVFHLCVSVPFTQARIKFSVYLFGNVITDEGEGVLNAQRVHICFGSRGCSDGSLCQHHPNAAHLNCQIKREKMCTKKEDCAYKVCIKVCVRKQTRVDETHSLTKTTRG